MYMCVGTCVNVRVHCACGDLTLVFAIVLACFSIFFLEARRDSQSNPELTHRYGQSHWIACFGNSLSIPSLAGITGGALYPPSTYAGFRDPSSGSHTCKSSINHRAISLSPPNICVCVYMYGVFVLLRPESDILSFP